MLLYRLLLAYPLHKEGLLPIGKNTRGTQKPGQCQPFFMPGSEVQILADQDGWAVEAVHIICCWQPRLLCDCMPFGLCNMPAIFQRLMQNCLGELKLTYCLIYLDNIKLFSHMAEEHLHSLHIAFDWIREHSLKLKPSKYDFFRNEITYLAHQVSKNKVCPGNSNLEAITECAPPWSYTEVCAFLGLVDHYRRFIKEFACNAQPLSEYLAGEGASKKSEQVSLTEEAMKAFEVLKQVCMMAPILAFAYYSKPFLLETDASKDVLGAVLLQKQADRWHHPIAYGSRALMPHEKNYHSTKLVFLALKMGSYRAP